MSDDIRIRTSLGGVGRTNALLRDYCRKVGRPLDSIIKQEGRGLGVELARFTRPFGFGEKAKSRGEKAVAADIYRVFKPPAEAFEKMKLVDPELADRFWADVTNRRFAKANKDLKDPMSPMKEISLGRLDPRLHKDSRVGKFANVPKRWKPMQIVTTPKAIDNYVTRKLKMVGFAKSSWINAAKAIGGRVRGAAQWAMRHKNAPGTARFRSGQNPSVTLINSLDYIEQVCPRSSVEIALRNAQGRLRKAMAAALVAVNARQNRAMNRRRAG